MKRLISLMALVGLSAGGVSPQLAGAAEPARKPNVIVIFSDDHGWTDLGVQGAAKDVKTPHLDALAKDGVLILGSGSLTHDLRSVSWRGPNEEPGWVKSFGDWVQSALAEGRTADLLDYRRLAPNAARNHPTEEHFLPLFVALGAAAPEGRIEHLLPEVYSGALAMDAYVFHPMH